MRIDCPYCGSRDLREFTYLGDADAARRLAVGGETVLPEAAADLVHLRDNPAGTHRGLWYHEQGCRSWLEIERSTTTHEIASVALCAGASR